MSTDAFTPADDVTDELKPGFCSRCHDKGYHYDGSGAVYFCTCEAGEQFWWDSSRLAGVPVQCQKVWFRTYSAITAEQHEAAEIAKEWARQVIAWKRHEQAIATGIVIHGPTGTGKSQLLAAAANSLIRNRVKVRWVNATKLYLSALPSHEELTGGILGICEELSHYDVVLLDDLGAEKSTEHAELLIYSLLTDRLENGKLLAASSNIGMDELRNRLGERNHSRLCQLCTVAIPLFGDDLRTEDQGK